MFSLFCILTKMASKRAKVCRDDDPKDFTDTAVPNIKVKEETSDIPENCSRYFRPVQHPLLNPLVLDNLFQYCDIKTVGSCRQVCNIWKAVANKTLRKRNIQTEFYTTKDFEKFCSVIKTAPVTQYPYVNYKFHWEIFKTINNPILLQCFNICKDILEELYLPLDYEYQDIEDKLTVIPAITLPLMANLSSFTLDMQHAVPELFETYVPQEGTSLSSTWSKKYLTPLFVSMPNINSFTLINRIAGQVHEILPHTRCVSEFVSQLLPLKNLVHLNLVALISDANLISMKNFRLKSITLNFYNSHISSDTFTEFLNSQTNSLECLKIEESEEFRRSFVIKFPRMEALKTLKVTVAQTEDNYFYFPSFAKIFPKLETFLYNRLNNDCSSTWFDKPCDTLKDAKIYFNVLPSPWIIYNMAQSFSSLTKLEIFCGRFCQHIFQSMHTLEELTILGCHLSNENLEFLLTGMRHTEVSEVLETPFEQRVRPSIGLLHKLRNLTLVGQTVSNLDGTEKQRLDLTDFTAYNAFLKMDSLKTLQIGPCKITEQCYKHMIEKFSVIVLSKDFFGANYCNPRMKL